MEELFRSFSAKLIAFYLILGVGWANYRSLFYSYLLVIKKNDKYFLRRPDPNIINCASLGVSAFTSRPIQSSVNKAKDSYVWSLSRRGQCMYLPVRAYKLVFEVD